jgi:hypothetical protein
MTTIVVHKTVYKDGKAQIDVLLGLFSSYHEADSFLLEQHNKTHSPVFQMDTVIGRTIVPYSVSGKSGYVVSRHYATDHSYTEYMGEQPIAAFDSFREADSFSNKENTKSLKRQDGYWHTIQKVEEIK